MRLRLDEAVSLSTETRWPGAAWGRHVFCLPEPTTLAAGDEVKARAVYSSDGLLVWAA
jgi:hypothetical protein